MALYVFLSVLGLLLLNRLCHSDQLRSNLVRTEPLSSSAHSDAPLVSPVLKRKSTDENTSSKDTDNDEDTSSKDTDNVEDNTRGSKDSKDSKDSEDSKDSN